MGLYKYDESGKSVKIESPQITVDPETGETKVHINGNMLTIPKELTNTITTIDSGWTVNYQDHVKMIDTKSSKRDQIKLVEQTCITFTELLLSITPSKAKEFVEKNCYRVRKAIITKLKKENNEEDEY